MAFTLTVTKRAGTDGTNATSVVFDDWFSSNDGLKAGDYIMVCASNQTGTATALALTSSTGTWTRLGNTDSPRVGTFMRSQIWWHKFNGTTLPSAPTVSNGNNTPWAALAWVVRDAPDVSDESWIDVTTRVDNNTQLRIHTINSVTTTTADCLVLTVFTSTSASALETPDRFWGIDIGVAQTGDNAGVSNPSQRVIVSSRAQYTAGATPTYDYVSGLAAGVRSQYWTIAIKNKTGGSRPIGILNPPTRIFDFYNDNNFTTASSVLTSLSSVRSTIEGQSVFAPATISDISTVAGLVTNSPPITFWYRTFTLTPPTATTGVSGVRWDLPATTDYTTGLWCLFFQRNSIGSDSTLGVLHYFEDNSGNWAVYRFLSQYQGARYNTIIRHLPDETQVDGSTTPVNLANITKRGIAYRQVASSTASRSFNIGRECIQPFVSPLTLVGGGATGPANARVIARVLTTGAGWNLASVQGTSQQIIAMPYQMGNGSTATYVDDESQALEYPAPGTLLGYRVNDDRQEIRIKSASGDTILFNAGIKSVPKPHNLIFDSTTSTSATYGMQGSFIGWTPTFKAGLTLKNGTYIRCRKVDAKSADTSNSIVRSSTATDAAMRIEAGATSSGSQFTKGTETYAIEISGTGTVTLRGTTYTGYTKPLNVLATSGTVTIELDVSDTEPAFDTAGATVVFSKPQSSFTVSNIVSGSRLLIRRTDTQAVLVNEVNTTGSRVYTYTYTANIPVEIVIRKASASPNYQEWRTTATLTATNGAVTANQILDE